MLGFLCPVAGFASGFDPTTGKVLLHDAAIGLGFEGKDSWPPGASLSALSSFGTPLPDYALEALYVADPEGAIEGDGYLEVGGRTGVAYVDLRGMSAGLSGRRIEVRIWQRVQGTRAHLALTWYAGGIEEVLAGDFVGGTELGAVVFQPTGRLTQDGWQEWSSGPIDADMADVQFSLLRIFDEQVFGLQSGRVDYDGAQRVQLDGLEVRDLGEAAVPKVSCRLADEAQTCGDQGACLYGRCVDAAPVVGNLIHDPTLRQQYLQRRVFELRYFEGGRFPLTQIDLFEPSLQAENEPTATARTFRTALNVAYQRLADGHAAPPVTSLLPVGANAGVCIYRGDADLMPTPSVRPMVFTVEPGTAFSDRLQPGDVLTAIDGLAPEDWYPLARRYSRYSGDPAGRDFVSTPELFGSALASGSVLTFARCTQTGAGRRCNSNTLQEIQIDTAELAAGVWNDRAPAWLQSYLPCDFRLHSAVPGASDHEYAYAATRAQDGVQYLQINGMPSYGMQGGSEWFDTITAALGSGPERVVFDQRLGSGGSIDSVDHLASYLTSPTDLHGMHLIPQMDRPMSTLLRRNLLSCSRSGGFTKSCGDFLEWPLGAFSFSQPVARTARLAVLTGADVSGNDFITRILGYRSEGETRIFGGSRTYGAFGVVWARPAFLGEIAGGSFQVHDTVFLTSSSDTNQDFSTGRGVSPDVEILQSQRDAVLGIDTVLEAAKAWVQQ